MRGKQYIYVYFFGYDQCEDIDNVIVNNDKKNDLSSSIVMTMIGNQIEPQSRLFIAIFRGTLARRGLIDWILIKVTIFNCTYLYLYFRF